MGSFIHYDGQLKNDVKLSEIIADVEKICKTNDWFMQVFYDALPEDNAGKELFKNEVFGLVFVPPESDPLFICFDTYGKLDNPVRKFRDEEPGESAFEHLLDSDNEEHEENEFIFNEKYLTGTIHTTNVQIFDDGMEAHKRITDLFKFLSGKYFSEFTMIDETGYWESGDERDLERHYLITDDNDKNN